MAVAAVRQRIIVSPASVRRRQTYSINIHSGSNRADRLDLL